MRRKLVLAAFAVLTLSSTSFAKAETPKKSSGNILIVFKDGHRATYNLSDIERIEFPAGALAESPTSATSEPPRGHYLGRWEVGDGNGNNFFITLSENGDAQRSLGNVRGSWIYVHGEAQVTWDDGAMDAIRKVGPRYQKFAYHQGETFSDKPDNVASARNTANNPI